MKKRYINFLQWAWNSTLWIVGIFWLLSGVDVTNGVKIFFGLVAGQIYIKLSDIYKELRIIRKELTKKVTVETQVEIDGRTLGNIIKNKKPVPPATRIIREGQDPNLVK